jgi:hypothetical protein
MAWNLPGTCGNSSLLPLKTELSGVLQSSLCKRFHPGPFLVALLIPSQIWQRIDGASHRRLVRRHQRLLDQAL